MRLQPASWRLRAAWLTHVVVAAGFGLFGGGLATLIGLVLLVEAVTVPPCEAASLARPDLDTPPFAYDPEARARAFVHAMANDEFRTAYEMLAPEQWGSDTLCEDSLEGLWRAVTGESDSTIVAVNQSARAFFGAMFNYLVVPMRLTLESAQVHRHVHLELTLLADGRITGYQIDRRMTEVGTDRAYPPPPYAKQDTFEEIEVHLGKAPWRLKGTITSPVGPGPFPAVVLTGSRDRDGTGSTTKLLRDEAWGLATRGVASLRFDQRTHAYAVETARLDDFTIDDELVDDMLAAVQTLRRTPRIDPGRVYVFGASLAGFAAPMAGQRDPSIAGLIIAVAPSGTLQEWAWRQRQYRVRRSANVTTLDERAIRAAKSRLDAIDAWVTRQVAPQDLTVHRSYYAHLGTYRPEVAVSRLGIPLLILSAERDRVVPPEDAQTWIESLRHQGNVAFRLYRGHSHSLIDELERPESSSVTSKFASLDVISDIAMWIHGEWTDRWCADLEDWYAGCRGG